MKQYPKYLQQNSTLTLEEGLKEYSSLYPFLNDNSGGDEESRWFRRHDVTHVVFGTLPFQLRGETLNDAWTMAGTTTTYKKYKEFFKYVSYDTVMKCYYKKYGGKFWTYWKMLKLGPAIILAYYRGYRMRKKWDWFNPEPYMNHSLADIRNEFNIKVICYEDNEEQGFSHKTKKV